MTSMSWVGVLLFASAFCWLGGPNRVPPTMRLLPRWRRDHWRRNRHDHRNEARRRTGKLSADGVGRCCGSSAERRGAAGILKEDVTIKLGSAFLLGLDWGNHRFVDWAASSNEIIARFAENLALCKVLGEIQMP